MASTRPLETRWTEIRTVPPKRNAPYVDRIRHALLATGEFRFPAGADDSARASSSAAVSTMRRLGYAIEASDEFDGYVCTNPQRDPTPAQFAAVRSKANPSSNGSRAHRSSRSVLTDVLPVLGADLVVVQVGFDREDRATITVRDEDGNRFTCAVQSIDAASSGGAGS
jgi:hypothetical protein